jgi:hypothetical protein
LRDELPLGLLDIDGVRTDDLVLGRVTEGVLRICGTARDTCGEVRFT